MERTIIILMFVLGILPMLHGQSDYREAYIIKTNGDSLVGFVNYREGGKNYRTCEFKPARNSKTISYSPSELLRYRFLNDKLYVSKEIEIENQTERIFLEVLVGGTLNLYKYQERYFSGKDTLFRELRLIEREKKISGTVMMQSYKEYQGVLEYLTTDCDAVKTNNIVYNERRLVQFTERYNECVGGSSESYKKDKPWVSTRIGVDLLITKPNIKFNASDQNYIYLDADFENDWSFGGGVTIELNSPRINERFSFLTGAYFLPNTFKTSTTRTFSRGVIRNFVTVELNQLKVPISFRYTIPSRNFAYYMNFGLHANYYLDSETTRIEEREELGVITTNEFDGIGYSEFQLGFMGGVGMRYKLGPISPNFEIRYEVIPNLITDEDAVIDGRISGFQFFVGISF